MLWINQPFTVFVTLIAVILAAFLLGVGLGPDRLPFPPASAFSDAVTSHWPNALFLRRAVLDDHTVPLWRPAIMSGQPFAANPLNKVWYPPQWLVFVLPPALHLNVLTWLHLVLAGAGAWVWSRMTGLLPWSAVLVGMGYALGPRLIASVGAGHLDLVYAAAWFPWLLSSVERVLRPETGRRGAISLGVFAALIILADVRLSAYALVVTTAYLVWRGWQLAVGWRQVGARVLLAGMLAAGLTAVLWVPLVMLRGELSRGELSLADAAIHSLNWGQWIGLLIGDHGGAWESMVYVGVSTLVLALVALLRQPRRFVFWMGVMLVVMVYALGDHFVVWPALNRLFPVLRWWRVPPRIWFVAALVLPYLAGWGAQLLAERPTERRIARLSVVGLLGGGLVCGVFSTLTLSSSLEMTAVVGTFALPAVALVMLLAIFGRLPARMLLVLFACVVLLDVVWIDRTLVQGRHQREWLDPYAELATVLTDDAAIRVYSPSYSLPQQTAVYWNIQQFDGVDPFQLTAYVPAFEAATGTAAEGYSVTLPAFDLAGDVPTDDLTEQDILARANREAVLDPGLLGAWLVTHVVSAFDIQSDGLELLRTLRVEDELVYVYRNARVPRATLEWTGPNNVQVRLDEPGTDRLYAVANGRWRDQPGPAETPGLPGVVAEDAGQEWTFEYSYHELAWSLGAMLVLVLMSWISWRRLPRA